MKATIDPYERTLKSRMAYLESQFIAMTESRDTLRELLRQLTADVRYAGLQDPTMIRNDFWMRLLTRCEAAIAKADDPEG